MAFTAAPRQSSQRNQKQGKQERKQRWAKPQGQRAQWVVFLVMLLPPLMFSDSGQLPGRFGFLHLKSKGRATEKTQGFNDVYVRQKLPIVGVF